MPRWILFAIFPLVLTLGVVTGVTVATFRQPDPPVLPTPSQVEGTPGDPADTQGPNPPSGTGISPPPVLEPPDLVEPGPTDTAPRLTAKLPLPVDEWPLGPQQPNGHPTPAEPSRTPVEVKSLVDARAVLAAEFGAFTAGGQQLFQVDYQLARDINYNTVLIGIVKIAAYNEWLRAVRDYPTELQNWLQAAANRVKPAAEKEQFNLTWTIFEVVPESPFGFLSREVTAMPRGGGYLVTRPLAAVTDVSRSHVAVATTGVGSGPATSLATPWSVYGPVLRFDPTDLYRPVRSGG